jgi:hypothetical protein
MLMTTRYNGLRVLVPPLAILYIPLSALADMGRVTVSRQGVTVEETAQKAIVLHNYAGEVLILGTKIGANLELPAACRLEPKSGHCKGNFERFYFDPAAVACKRFSYGGCGDIVPFNTREQCEKSCLPKN